VISLTCSSSDMRTKLTNLLLEKMAAIGMDKYAFATLFPVRTGYRILNGEMRLRKEHIDIIADALTIPVTELVVTQAWDDYHEGR